MQGILSSMQPVHADILRPKLALRVGITGHRFDKIDQASASMLEAKAEAILRCLVDATLDVQREANNRGEYSAYRQAARPDLRFATPLAEGADQFTARAAERLGFTLDVMLPFPVDRTEADFDEIALEGFRKLMKSPALGSKIELELEPGATDAMAYDAVGRLVLAHSDVLLTLWDRQPAAGLGGTAEIVAEAQQRGLIVVLLSPEGQMQLWTVPDDAVDPLADGEWQDLEVGTDGTCDFALADRLRKMLAPPTDDDGDSGESSHDRLVAFYDEPERKGSTFFGYNLLRYLFSGRRPFRKWVDYDLAKERDTAWMQSRYAAQEIGGPELTETLDSQLRERWIRADNAANHYGHAYRTAYIHNFTLAAVAVLTGLLAIFLWDNLTVKAIFVMAELGVIALIFRMTARARSGDWQTRLLDYRAVAEALRPARLFLLMGSATGRAAPAAEATPGKAWVSWYVRAVLRSIPPPSGRLGTNCLAQTLDVAMKEEIDGQIAYHDGNAKQLAHLDHELHVWADRLLILTAIAGCVFLLGYLAYAADLFSDDAAKGFKYVVKPAVTVLGGALPAFGAALFAIRSLGDYRAAARQSARTAQNLRALQKAFERQTKEPRRAETRALLARLGRTMTEDVRYWGSIFSEREVTTGF